MTSAGTRAGHAGEELGDLFDLICDADSVELEPGMETSRG
jgi:hypothetical protein